MTAQKLLNEATGIGRRIGKSDADAFQRGWTKSLDDDLHHPGDDTGRLMCAAFRANGAPGAADVLDAYLDAYNTARRTAALPEVPREAVADNLGWAASIAANDAEIALMRAEYKRRHGIK